jgi:hypothetical protein
LLGYCDRAYTELGTSIDYTEQQEHDKLEQVLNEHFKPEELRALLAEGAQWSDDRAYDEALKV